MTLVDVSQFSVRSSVLAATLEAITHAGRDRCEAMVLWTGRRDGPVFDVDVAYVPRQVATPAHAGACVVVPGDELHRLNVWLLDNRRLLGAQVHSHPGDAYHSDTDDAYPIVTAVGGLSVVVAHFGRNGVLAGDTASFRLGTDGWRPIEAAAIIRIVD